METRKPIFELELNELVTDELFKALKEVFKEGVWVKLEGEIDEEHLLATITKMSFHKLHVIST